MRNKCRCPSVAHGEGNNACFDPPTRFKTPTSPDRPRRVPYLQFRTDVSASPERIVDERHGLHQRLLLQLGRHDLDAERRADIHGAIEVGPCIRLGLAVGGWR
jgi:hypothetical protein